MPAILPTRAHMMFSRKPAARWQDALPSGNGALGAMVFGRIAHEVVVLNHEALWYGGQDGPVPDVSAYLPELRRLLDAGDFDAANMFLTNKMNEAGYDYRLPRYHPACDLRIDTPLRNPFRDYRRSLNFETGEVRVAWRDGQTCYARRLFVSRVNDLVALTLEREGAWDVSCSVQLAPRPDELIVEGKEDSVALPFDFWSASRGEWLTLRGRRKDGREFGAVARIVLEGGATTAQGQTIRVEGAQRATLLVKLFFNEPAGEAFSRLRQELSDVTESYDALLARHAKEHRRLFSRMRLDLAAPDWERQKDNEYLLLDAYNGELSLALAERMFDYGRYLLISSSREGGYPCHLQGVWNGDYRPPWNAMYTNNENVQMCYWQALPGNLAEVTRCYFDFYESFAENYRENATHTYGCGGFLLPLAQSPEAAHVLSFSPHTLYWTGAGAWIAQLFYDYYLFTGDRDFLRDRAVPFMREVARFYEDFMFLDDDGLYTFAPSNSPENSPKLDDQDGSGMGSLRPVAVNAAMDVALAKELFANLLEACQTLGVEEVPVERWQTILKCMRPYQVNEDGALREWLHPDLKDNYQHRHQSHIYPLFPGFEITREENPELFEACRMAIEKRLVIGLEAQTGWSLAHMANVYARLGKGDEAYRCLSILAQSCVGDNLLTYHNDWRGQGLCVTLTFGRSAPFQIDANMGWTAAVLEMLLFSRQGEIKVLPARPAQWPRGFAQGMRCRGGIEISIRWDVAQLEIEVDLLSQTAQRVEIGFPAEVMSLTMREGKAEVAPSRHGAAYRTLALPARKRVVFHAVMAPEFAAPRTAPAGVAAELVETEELDASGTHESI
jgi:alpha-L-fucosidase 2